MTRKQYEEYIQNLVKQYIVEKPSVLGLDSDMDVTVTDIKVDNIDSKGIYVEFLYANILTEHEVTVTYEYEDEEGEPRKEHRTLDLALTFELDNFVIPYESINKNLISLLEID